ncbi:hypothetical protein BDF22DRAFT_745717 [Syncephalis plumigaleata]|nr:hypothetical protein BDF22DRAFT_745717 [Syncephalis plumigaleata]
MLDAIHLREWKHPLGIFNLILLMIQSSCQLRTTWYGRESGALSARSLGFQVLVNFPLVCMLTFQKDVDWTIWSTQLGIFYLTCHYGYVFILG